jgi:putative ABC transport system permease protein
MIKNYLRVALRNLRNYRAYSFINIAGLAVGIACCIAIMLFVHDELSYDKFNKDAGRIYRPVLHVLRNGNEVSAPVTPAVMGPTLFHDLPAVAAYTRIRNFGAPVLRYGDNTFSENRFLWVDSSFFDVFTTEFIAGNPKTALTQPNTVVMTEETAKRYFGDENAIGKILNADNRQNYVVTGVVKSFPANSHFHFDFLGSLTTFENSRSPFWLSCSYYTYILLREGTDPVKFQKELSDEFRKYASPQLKLSMGVSLDQFEAAGNKFGFSLQPLTSIHLYSHLNGELEPNGEISYVYVFSAIAMAILLIACINFINLATARSERRSREVGIRKTLGSNRSQLVLQFITEAVLMSLLAVILAIGLVELFLPLFNDIAGKQMSLNLSAGISTIPLLVVFAVFVGLIAGSYPAFYLSSFEPVQVLKSDMRRGGRKALLRDCLVTFQFAISTALFVGTFIIDNQLRYIQNRDLGFDKEQVIVINKTNDLGIRVESFKQELLGDSRIVSASNSTVIPGNQEGEDEAGFWIEGKSSQQTQGLCEMSADYDFLNTYQMKLESGRFFSKDHPADTMAVVVNQAAERVLGVKNLVGKNIVTPGRTQATAQSYEVVGVVKDFNYESLHQAVQPLAIFLLREGSAGRYASVRTASPDYQRTIAFLKGTWKKYAGNETFDYNFLDQNLAHLYVAEQRTSKLVTIFSVLAIFVACLGLLGLVAFVTEQRTKEIGIRKVVGASVPTIMIMLSREFAKWVLIANVIAWPLAYYLMNNWLQNFAYRTDMSWWIYALAGIITFLISLLTVGFHTYRAATRNPVEALRYE